MPFPLLFSPLSFAGLTLRNRIVLSPMLTNYSDGQGSVTPRHLDYYGARASGGAAMIDVEATAVDLGGRGFPLGLGCWDDRHVEGLAALAGAIHQNGAVAILQIFHAGRQTNSRLAGAQPVAPSPIPCPNMKETPRELSRDEITQLVDAFAQGARRARDAGFDGVEVHGANGYLVNQFLSPYSNHRTDDYGVDLLGRTRFPVEIVRRIHEIAGADFPVLCRIAGDEFVEGGIKAEEAQGIARVLETAGVAVINVSAGVYGSMPPTSHPHGTPFASFSHLSEKVKAVVHVPVITASRITRPAVAEELLRSGKADLIALGRAHIADPDWARKSQEGRPEDIILCIDCNACNQRAIRPDMVCLVNPVTGREEELRLSATSRPKRVAVVGGGVPGLIAARMAAERGHRVVLYQEGDEPGGLLGLRGLVPHLFEWTESVDGLSRLASLAGVEVRPGSDLRPSTVKADNPDVVILAVSGSALRLSDTGFPKDRTFPFDIAMRGEADLGNRVAVVGGGVMGVEAAYYFASQGKQVTMIEEGKSLAADTHPSNRYYLLEWMKDVQVQVLTGAKLAGATGNSLRITRDGVIETIQDIDSLVLALGYEPAETIASEWEGVAPEVFSVGDTYEAHAGTGITYRAAQVAAGI